MKTFKLIFLAAAMLLYGCSGGGDDDQSDYKPGGKLNPHEVEFTFYRNTGISYQSVEIVYEMCRNHTSEYEADIPVSDGTIHVVFSGWWTPGGIYETNNRWNVAIDAAEYQGAYIESGALALENESESETKKDVEKFDWYDSTNDVYYTIKVNTSISVGTTKLKGHFNRVNGAQVTGDFFQDIINEPTTAPDHTQFVSQGNGTYDSNTDFTALIDKIYVKYAL